MKKKYVKLQKLLKAKTLSASHIDDHRDCDAIIGALLGFKDIDFDGKDWVADVTGTYGIDCVGRCVIPRFTSADYPKLLNYMIGKGIIKEDDRLEIVYTKGKFIINMVLSKPKGLLHSVIVSAPTLAVALCKMYVDLVVKK